MLFLTSPPNPSRDGKEAPRKPASASAVRVLVGIAVAIAVPLACSSSDERAAEDARHAQGPLPEGTPSAPPDDSSGATQPGAPVPPPREPIPDAALGCDVDADCVRIDKGCCKIGEYVAVHRDKVAAYQESLGCVEPIMCPMILAIDDHSVAQCDELAHTCRVVKPKDIQCQGFTPNSHACPDGWHCLLPPEVADVPGECLQMCGGFANLQCLN
ncbi:MAG: hypothetical protein K0S65_3778, partial [Labilithrix sp.]|nr:hypothetical protein [Labilithrix sp.]